MEGVEPEVQPKPEDKAQNPHRQCNKKACKRQFTPAARAYGKKPINKPNQARKPPPLNVKNQNKTQIRDVPSYIRTEMEILKHLRHVNHSLRVLLKPKCDCDRTPRNHRYCQPARARKEQKALMAELNQTSRRASRSQAKQGKSSGSTDKSDAATKSDATNTDAAHTEIVAAIDANSAKKDHQIQPSSGATHKRQHKCSCSQKCEAVESAAPPITAPTKCQRTFQRFILCFKPKMSGKSGKSGKCDKCKCAQNTTTGDTIVDSKGNPKNEIDAKFYHQKCGHRRCEKHLLKLTKRDSKVKFKPRRAGQHNQGKKAAKQKRTLKQKVLGPCFKCMGKEIEPIQKEETQSRLNKNEKLPKKYKQAAPTKSAPKNESTPTSASGNAQEQPEQEKPVAKAQEPERPSERTVAVAEKLQKCFRLFKPRKNRQPPDAEEEQIDLRKEFRFQKAQEKKSRYEGRHDVLNTLNFFPKPSHINVMYVRDIKEYRKNEAKLQHTMEDAKVNRREFRSRADTPSTSSLEEYFQRVSERMVREQKEADERKTSPRKKRAANSNLNRRRGQQQLQHQPRALRVRG